MTATRAMVPVLLCFNVEHEEAVTDEQFAARARALIELNLGKIGLEEETICSVSLQMRDERGRDLEGAVYPSDYPWCDTMAHERPDWECSKAEPTA
jgi:hypothetical protein